MHRFYESSEIAEYYIKYRPSYTKEVAQRVISYYYNDQLISSDQKLDLMVDVGCGSGQSTNIFQQYFDQIVGIDISLEQLKQAKIQNKFNNIEYVQGSAENIPVDDCSVDLIVAGTAAHWFDLDKFFDEVKRTLKPSGCLAIIYHYYPRLTINTGYSNESDSETASNIFKHAIEDYTKDPVQKFIYENIIKNRFTDMFERIPFSNKQRDDSMYGYLKWSVDDICGFVKSIQTYHTFMEDKIEELKSKGISVTEDVLSSIDPVVKMSQEFQSLWNIEDEECSEKKIVADFSYAVLLAKP